MARIFDIKTKEERKICAHVDFEISWRDDFAVCSDCGHKITAHEAWAHFVKVARIFQIIELEHLARLKVATDEANSYRKVLPYWFLAGGFLAILVNLILVAV